jgi:integrase
MKLTKANVAKLKLPPGKSEVIHFDDTLRRFGIRIRAGGKRTWLVQYRLGKQQRRLTLGDVGAMSAETAREEARRKLAAIDLGRDPQLEKMEARDRQAVTLGYVAGLYLDFHEARRRANTARETRRYLTQHFAPLSSVPVDKLERKHVAARLGEIAAESGATAAARARAALSAMFHWAIREGIAVANPVAFTNRPDVPSARDRVLSDDEIAGIWRACREDDYGRIVRLLILTGARRTEVGGMRWDEIDPDKALWTLPGERTKNGRVHAVPLAPLVLNVIATVPRREGRNLLFGDGTGSFSGWSKAKAALDQRIAAARVAATSSNKLQPRAEPMQRWSTHDIRRSVATHMAELGVQPHVIEAVLNHVSGHKAGVAGIYNRSTYEREVRAALALWADHVGALVEGRKRKVVAFEAAQS